MDREPDGLGLIGEGALDALFDPPCGVGGEFSAFVGVESFDGLHEADVAFGDEVEEREAVVGVVLSDFDDEAEVGLDHVIAGALAAFFDFGGEFYLLFWCEERGLADFAQVDFDATIQFDIGHEIELIERCGNDGRAETLAVLVAGVMAEITNGTRR